MREACLGLAHYLATKRRSGNITAETAKICSLMIADEKLDFIAILTGLAEHLFPQSEDGTLDERRATSIAWIMDDIYCTLGDHIGNACP